MASKILSLYSRVLLLFVLTLLGVVAQAQSDLHVASLTIDKQGLLCYGVMKGTVTLSEPPDISTRVKLFSSDDIIEMPQFVKLQAGQVSTTFSIHGKSVTERLWTTLSAAITKDFVRVRLYVQPPPAPQVILVQPWVVGGSVTYGTLDVFTKAPKGGFTVDLLNSNPDAVTIPSSVRIPTRKSNIEFEVVTHPVATTTTVYISGTVFGQTFVTPIEVRPPIVPPGWFPVGTNANMLNDGGKKPNAILKDAAPGLTAITTRMLHVMARADGQNVTKVRLVYANYDTEENTGERVPGNTITVKAAIERPSPNGPNVQDLAPIPVTFNGQPTVDILPGDYAVSDPVNLNYANGKKFYTRTTQMVADPNMTMCGGLSCEGGTDLGGFNNGEGMAPGDLAYSGYVTPNSKKGGYSPSAILGYSDTPPPALALLGDSILTGAGDGGYRFAAGSFAERVPTQQFAIAENPDQRPLCGYVHAAKGAEKVKDFLKSRVRFELSCLADTIVVNYLNNDIGAWDPQHYSEATIKANILRMIHRWTARGKRVVYMTCNPKTVSTDGFFSVTSQTVQPEEDVRQHINAWIRDPNGLRADANAPGQVIIWDICDGIAVGPQNVNAITGKYWAAHPVVYDTGQITTSAYLSPPSFRDKTKHWAPNELTGMTVTFTSGENANETRVIAYNDATGHIVLRGGYNRSNKLGDTFKISTGVFSIDGTHPTSWASCVIAHSFPYQEVFGSFAP